MHAVLLAGGKGTRLRPLTATIPKVLLPVHDVPVIELLIAQLRDQGIRNLTVVTGHHAEVVQKQLGSGRRLAVHIDYLRERQPLDTAGCLGQLLPPQEPFLLINADIVTNFCFADLVRFHNSLRSAATVAVCRHKVSVDFGVVESDAKGLMSAYLEKPVYEVCVSMGIYCVSPRVCGLVGRGERISMPQLLLRLRESGQVVGCYRGECYWRDIGSHNDYARVVQEGTPIAQRNLPRRAA